MINFYTKNIDTKRYEDIICRIIMLNGSNGKHLSGYYAWENFKDNWELNIIPTTKQDEFKSYYEHLDVETSDGIAWGVTGSKVIYMFVNVVRLYYGSREGKLFCKCKMVLYYLYFVFCLSFVINDKYTLIVFKFK